MPLARVSFEDQDFALFERYPRKVPFKEPYVPDVDKARFRDLRERLRLLVTSVAEEAAVGVPLRSHASSYSQNGRSQTDLWACVYPAAVPNKSYGLQVAIIISATGAELCLCLGAGTSQLRNADARAAAERSLVLTKERLRNTPPSVRRRLTAGLRGRGWQMRRRWREEHGPGDFATLDDWLAFAAAPDGDGASISRNFDRVELGAYGTRLGPMLLDLANASAPLLEHVYGDVRVARRPVRLQTAAIRVPRPTRARALAALSRDVHLDIRFLREIAKTLEDRRQVIFYGPPGTGKTYVARRLIEQIAPDEDCWDIVQFHPSYTYEDFVLGFRPALDSGGGLAYELREGPLLRLARHAAAHPGKQHVLLVDEINRGNLPRIFGELLFLLEYRDVWVSLMHAPEPTHDPEAIIDERGRFKLPDNLWLVGTMNTADRSIGLIDAALRRRFHFIPFFPGEGALDGMLSRWLEATHQPRAVQPLADWVDVLNAQLRRDVGRHLQIGHSYFMRRRLTLADVERIWRADILPFLEDQLFGRDDKLQHYELGRIRRAAGAVRADDADDQPR
ncbi:MAG TPA: AAA family ATPase [Conexibacter sp.]|nr:AAA family ATPase [Conexibacter sp.]